MEPANQKKLQEHLKAIAGILYQEAKTEELARISHKRKKSFIKSKTKAVYLIHKQQR